MKIPIDRYRLLGVSLGAENNIILNQLGRRLEKCEYSGFSKETQTKRNVVLKENAEILLNKDKRKDYEDNFIDNGTIEGKIEPTLEIREDCEIAGLLLLLESGEFEECLMISEQLFRQRRLNMNYFSADFKDLNRIIDHATLSYAEELELKRHYEAAAEILNRRIRNSSVGMGEKEMISMMAIRLKRLLPFRVLDMLSRTNSEESHKTGITLLKTLVAERGGLDNKSEEYMCHDEFYAFFRQIRSFLTVQEQIELYKEWGSDGSKAAVFLHCIALVAQGFSQRKPKKISDALAIMKTIPSDELQPMVANMHLLLGNVENAVQIFNVYADDELQAWLDKKAEQPLAKLCEWCREWLGRDVLKGYRDVDIEADIDSYFSDEDVVAYIEGISSDNIMEIQKTSNNVQDGLWNDDNVSNHADHRSRIVKKVDKLDDWTKQTWIGKAKEQVRRVHLPKRNLFIFMLITMTSCSLLLFKSIGTKDKGAKNTNQEALTITEEKIMGSKEDKLNLVKISISNWHELKKGVLSKDRVPMNASLVASKRLLRQLELERLNNKRAGLRQHIDAEVMNIKIVEETPKSLRVITQLRYRDEFVNAKGKAVEKTKEHTFQRYYNLVWQGGRWVVDK